MTCKGQSNYNDFTITHRIFKNFQRDFAAA